MYTAEIAAIIPVYRRTKFGAQCSHHGMPWLMRAVLILADGTVSANDLAGLLHVSFDALVQPISQLLEMGLIDWAIPAPVQLPPSYAFLRFAPLPRAIKLCGGTSYDRSGSTSHDPQHTRIGGIHQSGRRPVHGGHENRLFAA